MADNEVKPFDLAPNDLRRLDAITRAYMDMLREFEPLLEQWADVNRLRDPRYQLLLDDVRGAMRQDHEPGTLAAIARQVDDLLSTRAPR